MAAKCGCGCGQANTGRLRKVECDRCGNIAYQSRTAISRGLMTCPCGGTMVPPCVQDRVAAPGEVGEAAYREIRARESFSAIQSDRGRKSARVRAARRRVREIGVDAAMVASPAAMMVAGSTREAFAAEIPF